ncbi:MAG: thymidine phosphorylase [Ignavibacterium sp.]|nr:thymidine phosphorylase [Ignavibacterium sp.]MDW8375561.1 thymidine phosphorylase [Ignavibacteriales bacterium]
MNVIEIIKKKRDKKELTESEIDFLISKYTTREIPDYQFSAFLMAGFINGFSKKETAFLTKSMLHSGKVLNLNSITGRKVDKHSTGGVGDKTSLIIAPIVASIGIYVPMISGRGLGHTGGTLDKLESIPGFKTNLSIKKFETTLKKVGAALIGQTKEIAPADKFIYALRDVTGTVESIPLITASIMSKKLAEGIDALVLDVKTGSGAFMKNQSESEMLAESLVSTAKSFKKDCIAVISDMNQPLGNHIGNWLEVLESIEILRDGKKNDLTELSLILSGIMIYLGKKAKSIDEGIELAIKVLKSGQAFEKFLQIVKAQSGNINIILNSNEYPKSKYYFELKSEKQCFIKEMNTYEIGMAALELGAGRMTKDDKIDHKAGIIFHKKIGEQINKNDTICSLYSDSQEKINLAKSRIQKAIKFTDKKTKPKILIKKIIS